MKKNTLKDEVKSNGLIEGIIVSIIGWFIILAALFNLYSINAFVTIGKINPGSEYVVLIFVMIALLFGAYIAFKKHKYKKN